MTIVAISDTHGLHNLCMLPKGDLLIHAGDITENGDEKVVIDFTKWFSRQPFTYKIFIAGNHDPYFENNERAKIMAMLPENIIYLQNSGVVIEGINIWGSPVTPFFMDMAFNKHPGKEIREVWNKIPGGLDILITHGPPKDIFDNGLGCEDLSDKLKTAKPKFHIFGHIHEHNGRKKINGTTYINAALVNNKEPSDIEYKVVGSPHTFIL